MQLKLAYGHQGLTIDVPEQSDVIKPHLVPDLPPHAHQLVAPNRKS